MKNNYSQYYSIVEEGAGAPFHSESEGVPFARYHFIEGRMSMALMHEIMSEVRHNFAVLGFGLEGSPDYPLLPWSRN
jgi:hypothetical protein